jgi:hypothetical protein
MEGEEGGWKQEDRAKLLTFLHICILLFQIILKFTVLFKLEWNIKFLIFGFLNNLKNDVININDSKNDKGKKCLPSFIFSWFF